MLKTKAFELLGGTASSVAAAVGVTPSAVSQWPAELPDRIADRVLAALARKHLPADMLGEQAAAQAPQQVA
jgi:DNA-binding transcriptional regulator YdaS (Cro superfamily)